MVIKRSGVVFIDKSPLLTNTQVAVIAEISRNAGLALLAAIVIPYLFTSVDKPSGLMVVLASITTLALWIFSLFIVKYLDFI